MTAALLSSDPNILGREAGGAKGISTQMPSKWQGIWPLGRYWGACVLLGCLDDATQSLVACFLNLSVVAELSTICETDTGLCNIGGKSGYKEENKTKWPAPAGYLLFLPRNRYHLRNQSQPLLHSKEKR
jgi:hypothetical protein